MRREWEMKEWNCDVHVLNLNKYIINSDFYFANCQKKINIHIKSQSYLHKSAAKIGGADPNTSFVNEPTRGYLC